MREANFTALSDLAAAEGWLDGLINRERCSDWSHERLDLRAIEALLDALEHPERGLSVVHIAGSKGKGSTALMVESILRAAGLKVGTFTSPHLQRWTERFRIDGLEVDPDSLVAAVNRVGPFVERQRADPALAPSFFDAITAAAWCLFQESELDHVVMEVGLGGRLDSTNAVAPAVTCITSIELEHTDKLGHTLAAIAERPEDRDERDRMIAWKAENDSSWILGVGVLAAIFGLAAPIDPAWIANGLLATLFLSEVLKRALQLRYYRRGI